MNAVNDSEKREPASADDLIERVIEVTDDMEAKQRELKEIVSSIKPEDTESVLKQEQAKQEQAKQEHP